MPPVLGPASLSPTRLKSCAGSSGTTVSPSTMHNIDTSGPSRNDSSSTGWPASSNAAAWARAASRSAVTTTPLPAASPSSLTTHALSSVWSGPNRSNAASRCAGLSTISLRAVDTPCGRHHVFGERLRALDPRGGRRRAETRDPGGAHRVRDAEHQRHLGPDDHQVGGGVGGQLGDGLARGDIDGMGSARPPRCRHCPAL